MSILHLGIKIREKESNRINKEFYLRAKPEYMKGWSEADYARQRLKAALNYDMNMQLFASLDKADFCDYIAIQCKKFKMTECTDLRELDGVEGLYMLVLDEYKQVYIGISGDIKKRIQSHWNKQKSLERLIFGDILASVISIDCFGALDTTRVFYIKSNTTAKLERKVVNAFDPLYTLNRTAGGIGMADSYTDTSRTATVAVIAHARKKVLTPYADVDLLKEAVLPPDFKYYLRKYPELKDKLKEK